MTEALEDAEEHYYGSLCWGAFPPVQAEINRRVSGRPETDYIEQFARIVEGRPTKRALILNCGNGWVERSLAELGAVDSVVGVDWSESLLSGAREDAVAIGLDAEYMSGDIADFEPPGRFDMVVNVAACHHIRYLDRVLRRCCAALHDDGLFLSFDYVGPHRNQYPWEMWDAASQANQMLPEAYRSPMTYPHLPTMLEDDPTEAVHSELILEYVGRYFDLIDSRPLGGAVAYLVLTHNVTFHEVPEQIRDPLTAKIIDADTDFLVDNPGATLFHFGIGRPDKAVLEMADLLAEWRMEEDAREAEAEKNGDRYYPETTLQRITNALSDAEIAAEHRLTTIHELQRDRDDLMRERGYLRRELDAAPGTSARHLGSIPNHLYRRLVESASWQRLRSRSRRV